MACMARVSITRAGLALLGLAALAGGCGDDGGGGGDEGPTPGVGRWAVPRVWTAGERFGYAVISEELVDPEDLGDPDVEARDCVYDVQFAEAAVDGGLGQLDREGACILVDDLGVVGLPQAQLNPLCADVVEVGTSAFGTTLDLCVPGGNLPAPVPFDSCSVLNRAPDAFSVSSGLGMDPADAITMLEAEVERPSAPVIEAPTLAASGIGLWPDGPLEVRWAVPSRRGSTVEVIVSPRNDSDGPHVRCLGDDDGVEVVAERLLEAQGLRDAPVVVRVVRTQQATTSSDGIPFRISWQLVEAFWLNGRS